MSTLINRFKLPDNAHRGNDNQTITSHDTSAALFCTETGLVGLYLNNDRNNAYSSHVSLYNPAIGSDALQSPFAEFVFGDRMKVCYSIADKGILALPWGYGSGRAPVFLMNPQTGAVQAYKGVNTSMSPPDSPLNYNDYNLSSSLAIAYDGANLHMLTDTGYVWVIDIGLDPSRALRMYYAPFGPNTCSMCYDGAGAIYFGSGGGLSSHVAKVKVGTGGATPEGTVLKTWVFDEFNTDPDLTGKQTLVAWTGRMLMVNRKGDDRVYRFDLRSEVKFVVASPSPARVPSDGVTNSQIPVQALDESGLGMSGARVHGYIDNGQRPEATKTSALTDVAITASEQDGATAPVAGVYTLSVEAGTDPASYKLSYNGAVIDNVPYGATGVALHGGAAGLLTVSAGSGGATGDESVSVALVPRPVFGTLLSAYEYTNASGDAFFNYRAGTTPGTDYLYFDVEY